MILISFIRLSFQLRVFLFIFVVNIFFAQALLFIIVQLVIIWASLLAYFNLKSKNLIEEVILINFNVLWHNYYSWFSLLEFKFASFISNYLLKHILYPLFII